MAYTVTPPSTHRDEGDEDDRSEDALSENLYRTICTSRTFCAFCGRPVAYERATVRHGHVLHVVCAITQADEEGAAL